MSWCLDLACASMFFVFKLQHVHCSAVVPIWDVVMVRLPQVSVSVSLHLHFHEWRNMRLVAGRRILDHSLRPRCWLALGLKWVTLSSANLLRGEKMDINLLATTRSRIYTPTQPNLNAPTQAWAGFWQRWCRMKGKGQMRQSCDKVCELKPTLHHVGWRLLRWLLVVPPSPKLCLSFSFFSMSLCFHISFHIFQFTTYTFRAYLVLLSLKMYKSGDGFFIREFSVIKLLCAEVRIASHTRTLNPARLSGKALGNTSTLCHLPSLLPIPLIPPGFYKNVSL